MFFLSGFTGDTNLPNPRAGEWPALESGLPEPVRATLPVYWTAAPPAVVQAGTNSAEPPCQGPHLQTGLTTASAAKSKCMYSKLCKLPGEMHIAHCTVLTHLPGQGNADHWPLRPQCRACSPAGGRFCRGGPEGEAQRCARPHNHCDTASALLLFTP